MQKDEFEAFHAAALPRVVGQVWALTGDLPYARERTQDAFVAAWAERRRLDRDGAPEAWVRRRALAGTGRSSAAPSGPGDQQPLLAALDGLQDGPRRAVVLHHLAGVPVAGCGTELGVPAATATDWLATGVRELGGLDAVDRLVGSWVPPVGPFPTLREVRRHGDRARSRRTRFRALVGATLLALLLGGGAVVADRTGWSLADLGRGGNGPGPDQRERLDLGPDIRRPGGIPPDFPLAAGLVVRSADALDGPARDVETFAGRTACGRTYDLLGQVTDRLALTLDNGDGPLVSRELVLAKELDLSPATLAAQGILERFVAEFDNCPVETDPTTTPVTTSVAQVDLGDEAWTVRRVTEGGGQELLVVVRYGNAVLVSQQVTPDPAASLERDVAAVQDVVDEMCLWSPNGCGLRSRRS